MTNKDDIVFGLELLLEYAKLLEEKDLLSYDLLRQRVESLKEIK